MLKAIRNIYKGKGILKVNPLGKQLALVCNNGTGFDTCSVSIVCLISC